ncbi:MAG TPA: hypothetical protein VH092_27870 [Urbifossiella sp.]|nr:hypothetical protein [Urbifossiella sp.]
MYRTLLAAAAAVACLTAGIGSGQPPTPPKPPVGWKSVLAERVQAFGHRNWIVIADSAYPVQTRGGIETVVTGADHLTVVRAVLDELARAKHVRPVVSLDAELPHVPEADAPGIGRYRDDLAKLLGGRRPQSLPHEEVIARLDKAGETFRVLVLKTDLVLPYTSVFLELDCGYWSPDAERRLREAMKAGR